MVTPMKSHPYFYRSSWVQKNETKKIKSGLYKDFFGIKLIFKLKFQTVFSTAKPIRKERCWIPNYETHYIEQVKEAIRRKL